MNPVLHKIMFLNNKFNKNLSRKLEENILKYNSVKSTVNNTRIKKKYLLILVLANVKNLIAVFRTTDR